MPKRKQATHVDTSATEKRVKRSAKTTSKNVDVTGIPKRSVNDSHTSKEAKKHSVKIPSRDSENDSRSTKKKKMRSSAVIGKASNMTAQQVETSALISDDLEQEEKSDTSDIVFVTRGSLTKKESSTSITSHDGKSLAIKGALLNESILDMLVTCVGNVQSIRRLRYVQILTTTTFSYWSTRICSDTPLKSPSSLKQKLSCNELHAIASPIYCQNHWTLMILVNKKFVPNTPSFDANDWRMLYFDSLPPNRDDQERALSFSQWLLQLKEEEVPELFTVPTPKQAPGSNDCGLLVAHFLRVFLRSFASNVRDYSLALPPILSKENLNEFWEFSRFPSLREEALQLFQYKKDLHYILHIKQRQTR